MPDESKTTNVAGPSYLRVVGKALLWGLAGAFIAPIAVLVLVLILNAFNPVCGTPGDSGGCEMGVAVAAVGSIIPGAVIGLALGLWRGWRQRT